MFHNLNTSHVLINLTGYGLDSAQEWNLNTSHVLINLMQQDMVALRAVNLNTSHVLINRILDYLKMMQN